MRLLLEPSSGDVVLPARREDIDHQRFFDCGCPMLHAPANHKCATRTYVERLPLAGDPEMPMYDVNNLVVGMAMHRSHPAFHHFVLRQKQFVIIGEHAPFQAALRLRLLAIFLRYDHKVRKALCLCFHLLSPTRRDCSKLSAPLLSVIAGKTVSSARQPTPIHCEDMS